MVVNMFETRTMLKAVEEMKPAKTFLRDTFFGDTETFETEHVDIDIIKGKRKVAPFVAPVVAGKVVENQGYTTKSYKAPLVKPKKITNAEQLLKRNPGESIYSSKSPDERAAEKLGKDLVELDDMITRREEVMCAQALFEGKITVKGDGYDDEINFNLTNTETLTNSDRWTDTTGSDPYEDLKEWRLEIMKASGMTPDICVMASDVVSDFINHPKIQKLLDIRKVEIGKIEPQQLPNGATYIGTLASLGLDIYSYDEWYYDEATEADKPMVPAGTVLIGSTRAQFKRLYGAIVDAEEGTFVGERFPRSWTQKDPSARFIEMQSRTLPVPAQIDSIYVAKVK